MLHQYKSLLPVIEVRNASTRSGIYSLRSAEVLIMGQSSPGPCRGQLELEYSHVRFDDKSGSRDPPRHDKAHGYSNATAELEEVRRYAHQDKIFHSDSGPVCGTSMVLGPSRRWTVERGRGFPGTNIMDGDQVRTAKIQLKSNSSYQHPPT